jgi:lipopolysaccharide transport system ATP-binding protein
MITGTTLATTGRIDINGTVAAILELGMGFHPDFTGRQNAFMAGQLLGIDVEEMSSLIPKIEEFAEIGDYIDQPIRIYSSGMSVRLAFAVATAKRPDILIVDEALSVGDAYFQHKSFRRIRQFQSEGTTLLLVSHDIAAIRSICDHAIWLDKGVVRLKGETKDVVDAYAASLYENNQDIAEANTNKEIDLRPNKALPTWFRDARQDFINASNIRNDIKVFEFDENAERWGDGAAKIVHVRLTDADGILFSWMVGGEEVLLTIEARALRDIDNVILGFIVRDRLGQPLFGDNTFLTTIDKPVSAKSGQNLDATFRFLMPILPQGSYAVTAAMAIGTQENHVINDWVNQAIMFDSQNRTAVSGMIGIPMNQIDLNVIE